MGVNVFDYAMIKNGSYGKLMKAYTVGKGNKLKFDEEVLKKKQLWETDML